MTTTIRIEKRQRGIFGWIFHILFWAFNAFMAFALFGGVANNAEKAAQLTDEVSKAGYAIGTAMGAGMVLGIWVLGAILLGIIVLMTRGKKVITETVR